MARGSKTALTLEQAMAIVLPHGGERTAKTGMSKDLSREPFHWDGIRGRACCVHVFSSDRADVRGHRCGKIAAVTETTPDGDRDYCTFHSSPAVAKRDAVQEAKWAADRAKSAAAYEARKLGALAPTFKAALEAIAAGDNDPRRTARIALGLETADEKETY